MIRVGQLLRELHQRGGSDLHLASGLEPRMRVAGAIEPLEGWPPLDDHILTAMMREMADPDQWARFERSGDLDFAHGSEDGRFRVSYFCQNNGLALVCRIIPSRVPSLEELGAPRAVRSFAHLHAGLALVSGPSGAGKTTTLAAIVDMINARRHEHIVTIEAPIEFVHEPQRSLLSQREVGSHSDSFASALRVALRQDPDVILVGELSDHATIALALKAAEMGKLVLGAVRASGVTHTIDRLVEAFPPDERQHARRRIAGSLAGIVSQILLPASSGHGSVAAHEVLLRTPQLASVVRDGDPSRLASLIADCGDLGMQTMDDALESLVEAGLIQPYDAYQKALHKARFEY